MFKFSVFTVMLPDMRPDVAARAIHDAGYEGVEWRIKDTPVEMQNDPPSFWQNNLCTFPLNLDAAKQARTLAVDSGLAIPSLGTYIEVGDIESTEAAMQFAELCGARQIRVGVGRWPNDQSYADCFIQAQNYLEVVQDLAKQYAVKALIEIHHGTIVPSASLTYRLVSKFDPEHIGVIHDAGNMVHEGYENYALGIQLLGPYLAHVHIKNTTYARPANGGIWKGQWAPLEDGVVDWYALLNALIAARYDGWLGLEDFSQARPSADALVYNIDFLKRIIAEL